MEQPQVVTDLAESPDEDYRRRVRQYSLSMGIRVVCIIACLFVRDWWLLVPAIGAIVLPYVAVVLGNVGSRRRGRREDADPERPALAAGGPSLELPAGPASGSTPGSS